MGFLLLPSLLGGWQAMFLPYVQHCTYLVYKSFGNIRFVIHCDAGYFLTVMAGTKPHFICIDTEPISFDYFLEVPSGLYLTEQVG